MKCDIGLIFFFFSIEVKQNKKDIFISKKEYINQDIKKIKIADCKPVDILVVIMRHLLKPFKIRWWWNIDPTYFKTLNRKLEICNLHQIKYFIWNYIMEKPILTQWKPSKKYFFYIKSTMTHSLFYSFSNYFRVIGYSNSNWGVIKIEKVQIILFYTTFTLYSNN